MTKLLNHINTYADLTAYNNDMEKDYPNISYIKGTDEVKWKKEPDYTCKVVYSDGHIKYINTPTVDTSKIKNWDSSSSEYATKVKKIYFNCTAFSGDPIDQLRGCEWIEFETSTPPTGYDGSSTQLFYCPIYVPSDSVEQYRTAYSELAWAILSKPETETYGHLIINIQSFKFAYTKTVVKATLNGNEIDFTNMSINQPAGLLDITYRDNRITPIEIFDMGYSNIIKNPTIDSNTTNYASLMFNGYVRGLQLPDNVEYIHSIDWYYNLTAEDTPVFTVPEKVKWIRNYVFEYYKNSVIMKPTTPPVIFRNTFNENYTYPIYVPSESVEAYKTATNWSRLADRIQSIS